MATHRWAHSHPRKQLQDKNSTEQVYSSLIPTKEWGSSAGQKCGSKDQYNFKLPDIILWKPQEKNPPNSFCFKISGNEQIQTILVLEKKKKKGKMGKHFSLAQYFWETDIITMNRNIYTQHNHGEFLGLKQQTLYYSSFILRRVHYQCKHHEIIYSSQTSYCIHFGTKLHKI